MLLAAPALGAGFTIPDGVTATTTQDLGSDNTGLIAPGGTIDTSGTSGPGVSGQNANILTNQGVVTAETDGIVLVDGNQITNEGTVTSGTVRTIGIDGYDGIQAGDNNTIVNRGNITGIDDGVDIRNGNTITNYGTITGSDSTSWDGVWGILTGNNNRIYNEVGAFISSGQSEVRLGDDNYVRNSGTIGDSDFSIFGYDRNEIVVTSTGLVLGNTLLRNGNTVTNHGGMGGINIQNSSKVYNYGTVRSLVVSGTDSYVKNAGVIERGITVVMFPDGAVNEIFNTGLINGSVYGFGGAGTLIISGTTGSVESATDDAIAARSYGAGTVTVDVSGDVTSEAARGIYAFSYTGALSVTTQGAVKGETQGIYAVVKSASGTGDVAVNAKSGSVTSDTRAAIFARNYGNGNVAVTGGANITSSGSGADHHGIDARAGVAGAVTVDVSGDVTSEAARGIHAFSDTGALSVTTQGAVKGETQGIYAVVKSASGTGDVAVNAKSGSVTSDTQAAIFARNYGNGNVAVTGGADITASSTANDSAHGIDARAEGAGTVTVDVSGDVTSAGAMGINARSETGAVSVKNTGSVAGKTEGVYAASFGAAAMSVSSAGHVTSSSGRGIAAYNLSGAVTVAAGGTVSAEGYAVSAISRGAGAVSVSNTGHLTSSDRMGIYSYSKLDVVMVENHGGIDAKTSGISARGGGGVIFSGSGGVTSSEGYGVIASSKYGSVTLTNSGKVASKLTGISAYAKTGAVNVTVTDGSVVSQSSSAVRVVGGGNLAVSVSGAATGAAGVNAAGVAFGLTTGFGGADNSLKVLSGGVVNNAGGLGQLAILGFSGSEAVSNAGTVSGNIDLGGGANSFVNQTGGVFNMGGTVSLGAGNTLSNAGTLSPGGDGAVAATAVTGHLAQTAGGVMAVDINPAAGTADRV
ncbi:MAG: beta strand repeat-containing protein, partial [Aestuariivirga sp.]|uniref:beta strand repeat-containing protein n=1 Tax=Aestuariivirga sp. TaxID=2650926 RepID=UPI0038D1F6D2